MISLISVKGSGLTSGHLKTTSFNQANLIFISTTSHLDFHHKISLNITLSFYPPIILITLYQIEKFFMARKPRLHYQGALYHVMLRGNAGENIFFTDSDRRYFYYLLNDGINRFGYRVHAFCLMSNHIHLAIQVGDIPLSKIMQNISFRYTRLINARLKRVGHLFQGRYKAILIESDRYLKELIRYIHLNPIKARIAKNLDDYEWSSHHTYVGKHQIPWLTSHVLLNSFSDNRSMAIQLYHSFMCSDNLQPQSTLFKKGNQKGYAILCNDDFLTKLPPDLPLSPSTLTIDVIVLFIAEHYKVNINDLKSHSKTQLHCDIRVLTGLIAVKLNIASLTIISRYFNRDASGFARLIKRKEATMDNHVERLIKLLQMSRCQA